MKRSLKSAVVLTVAASLLVATTLVRASPGEVDFARVIEPAKADQCVEINVGRILITLAAKFVQEPETAKLLNSVHSVRVNVLGVTDDNRKELVKNLKELHGQLDKQGWQRVVSVQNKTGEDVRVCVKTRGSDAVEGLFVSVLDGEKEAVLINIVGDLKPEQITAVGKALNIEQIEKAGEAIKQ